MQPCLTTTHSVHLIPSAILGIIIAALIHTKQHCEWAFPRTILTFVRLSRNRYTIFECNNDWKGACSSLWGAGPQCYALNIAGKGSFAVVYGSYSKAQKKYVAVKCVNGCRSSTLRSLTTEADSLRELNSLSTSGSTGYIQHMTLNISAVGDRDLQENSNSSGCLSSSP